MAKTIQELLQELDSPAATSSPSIPSVPRQDTMEELLKKLDQPTLPEQIINRGEAVVNAVSEGFTQTEQAIGQLTEGPLELAEHFLSVPDPGEHGRPWGFQADPENRAYGFGHLCTTDLAG